MIWRMYLFILLDTLTENSAMIAQYYGVDPDTVYYHYVLTSIMAIKCYLPIWWMMGLFYPVKPATLRIKTYAMLVAGTYLLFTAKDVGDMWANGNTSQSDTDWMLFLGLNIGYLLIFRFVWREVGR